MSAPTYPVHVRARLDDHLSRWRWLVKWFLAIPHYFVLAFLWVAFVVLSCYAFFAILFTGRYPRAVFDFNVGVLRWTWRVHYYAFGALATDRYPPFTLHEVSDYPAHLDIAYPQHLSRGLVLVKWWLLAIPHYLIIGLFLGGGSWAVSRTAARAATPGLIGLLALIAAVVLLFTGRYPRPIFDFVLGLNRWVLRVAAYAGLMTDAYPPFRLDMGGDDSTGTVVLDKPTTAVDQPAARSGWTGLRITSVVFGALLALLGLGGAAAGGVGLWLDHHRDGGYVTSSTVTRHSGGYAVVSSRIELGGALDATWPRDFFGTVRIRVTSATPLFVGIAPSAVVDRYLAGVPHTVLSDFAGPVDRTVDGTVTPAAPASAGIWTAHASGAGQQELTWIPRSGNWTVVVMNADAARDVSVTGDIGARIPDLGWIATGVLIGAGVALLLAAVLIAVPIRRAARPVAPPTGQPA